MGGWVRDAAPSQTAGRFGEATSSWNTRYHHHGEKGDRDNGSKRPILSFTAPSPVSTPVGRRLAGQLLFAGSEICPRSRVIHQICDANCPVQRSLQRAEGCLVERTNQNGTYMLCALPINWLLRGFWGARS